MTYGVGAATSRFYYAGPSLIAEVASAGGAILRRYVPGPGEDEAVVWYEGAGTASRRWLQADERGSVVAVSDASGAAIGINRYDEYGMPMAGNLGRFGYTGQVWLNELGLHHYKARMYSFSLGRFMQTDPIGYGDGMNWYAYAGNDPVNRRDPSGLADIVVTGSRGGGSLDFGGSLSFGYDYGAALAAYAQAVSAALHNAAVQQAGGRQSGKPHKYTVRRSTACSANDAFDEFKAPGMSAPGAPRATEGPTGNIPLWGITSPNPISQNVNSATRTITNTTLPGHVFFPGQVIIQVNPISGGGSNIAITGTGVGDNRGFNAAAFYGFFGTVATAIMQACNPSAGVAP